MLEIASKVLCVMAHRRGVYDDCMVAQEEERIITAIRAEMTLLMKQYARIGYKTVHEQEDDKFEELWGQIFDPERSGESPRD